MFDNNTWNNSTELDVLSLAAVIWSRLPDMVAGKAQYSCHAADPLRALGWGASPWLLPLLEGLSLSPGAWDTLFRGIQTGPEAYLGMPGVSGLRSYARTYLKKAWYSTHLFGVSVRQITTINLGKGINLLILLVKWVKCCSFSRMVLALNNPQSLLWKPNWKRKWTE